MCVVAAPLLYAAAGGAAAYGGAALAGASGAALAGSVIAGVAQGASAGASVEAAKLNVQAAEAERESLENQAKSELSSASYEAQQKTQQTRAARSKAAVQYAASGFNPNTGSGSDIQQDIVGVGAADRSAIMTNAARKAWGLREEGENAVDYAETQLGSARTSAASSILTSAATPMLGGF